MNDGTGSTKYRSHAIKEPVRHRPAIIAFYRQKEGGTKNYGFYYHCVVLEIRVYIPLKDKDFRLLRKNILSSTVERLAVTLLLG